MKTRTTTISMDWGGLIPLAVLVALGVFSALWKIQTGDQLQYRRLAGWVSQLSLFPVGIMAAGRVAGSRMGL